MPSLFELILGSVAKHADLMREEGIKLLLCPPHALDIAPTRADFERRLSGSEVPLTGPEREAFLDGMEAVDLPERV